MLCSTLRFLFLCVCCRCLLLRFIVLGQVNKFGLLSISNADTFPTSRIKCFLNPNVIKSDLLFLGFNVVHIRLFALFTIKLNFLYIEPLRKVYHGFQSFNKNAFSLLIFQKYVLFCPVGDCFCVLVVCFCIIRNKFRLLLHRLG